MDYQAIGHQLPSWPFRIYLAKDLIPAEEFEILPRNFLLGSYPEHEQRRLFQVGAVHFYQLGI
jgi:hypothetical protein